jgi:hypothetical protein
MRRVIESNTIVFQRPCDNLRRTKGAAREPSAGPPGPSLRARGGDPRGILAEPGRRA